MTYEEALAKYRSGDWKCESPPVYTGFWTEEDWVFYIFGVRKES